MRTKVKLLGDKAVGWAVALLDSGASDSLIRRDIAEKLTTIVKLRRPRRYIMADGKGRFTSQEGAALEILIGKDVIVQWFYVVDSLGEEIILGTDAFQRWRFKLDFRRHRVMVDREALRLQVMGMGAPVAQMDRAADS